MVDVSGYRWRIEVLGDLRVSKDGEPVNVPGSAVPRILAIVALAGEKGLRPQDLQDLLGRGKTSPVTKEQLQTNLRTLRRVLQLPVTTLDEGSGVYRLGTPGTEVTVDAWDFVAVVARLVAAGGDTPDASRVGPLLSMWRGNPFVIWQVEERNTILGPAREDLIEIVREVVRTHAVIPELAYFADQFPTEDRLRRLVKRQMPQGKLLVVEDQILEDLTEILEAEGYDVLPVASYAEWLKIRETREFDHVTGALIDRHLRLDLTPRDEGLLIAEFLRDNTMVRASLLTMDTDPSTAVNVNLLTRYRLLDSVRKEASAGAGLDEGVVRDAAAKVMRPDAEAQKLWLKQCLASAKLQADTTFGRGKIGRARLEEYRRELKDVETLLDNGATEEAAEAFAQFVNQRL